MSNVYYIRFIIHIVRLDLLHQSYLILNTNKWWFIDGYLRFDHVEHNIFTCYTLKIFSQCNLKLNIHYPAIFCATISFQSKHLEKIAISDQN